jgi:hypothetical protein
MPRDNHAVRDAGKIAHHRRWCSDPAHNKWVQDGAGRAISCLKANKSA